MEKFYLKNKVMYVPPNVRKIGWKNIYHRSLPCKIFAISLYYQKLENMNLEKLFKTGSNEVANELSPLFQKAFIMDVIEIYRKNPNHQKLGAEIDKYVKKVINGLR